VSVFALIYVVGLLGQADLLFVNRSLASNLIFFSLFGCIFFILPNKLASAAGAAFVISYILLYRWRGLPLHLRSFGRFFIIIFLLILYSYIFVVGMTLEKPILIENVKAFTVYRYLINLLLGIFALLCISAAIFLKRKPRNWFPNLKAETTTFLQSWDPAWSAFLYVRIMYPIYSFKKFRIILGVVHAVVLTVLPLLQRLLFVNFIFFSGDLRLVLYTAIFSLVRLIYSHVFAAFYTYITGYSEYMRKILQVSFVDPSLVRRVGIFNDEFFSPGMNTKLEFTSFGLNEHLRGEVVGLKDVSDEWENLIVVELFLGKIQKLEAANVSLLIISCVCWGQVCYDYFFDDVALAPYSFFKQIGNGLKSLPSRPKRSFASTVYKIKPERQKDLEKATENAYRRGHPIISDPDKKAPDGTIPFEAALTHGPGSNENPSQKIANNDFKGSPREQNAIYKTGKRLPSDWATPIENTESYVAGTGHAEKLKSASQNNKTTEDPKD